MTIVSEGFRVDDATANDAALLAELGARTFYESFAADNDPEDMRRHLESQFAPSLQLAEIANPALDTLLLRDAEGRAVAFAQVRAGKITDGVPAEGSIELWRFYVDKSWHGRGIAHALMDAAKARARRRGARTMWLGVWERNARAQAFYRKHGFEKVGSHVFVVGSDPQTDDVLLCAL
ncbi:MAG: GNAT family N-acetyltransferase [Steroidobacteraceae bacterium]|nr:GNAT family N-acetyltransferase [Steroidobacteraceae bacterium]